jgi:hypothetical protein
MKTICLDFDGVIHQFTTPWTESCVIPDPPVPGAFEAIVAYMDAGIRVAVLSARSATNAGRDAMAGWFQSRGGGHLLKRETVIDGTRVRSLYFPECKPAAVLYVDDRAWQFTGNNFPTVAQLEQYVPWNKKDATWK